MTFTLTGIWSEAVLKIQDTLGGDGYQYYDYDITTSKNPDDIKRKGTIFHALKVLVKKSERSRAAERINSNIQKLSDNWQPVMAVSTSKGPDQDHPFQIDVRVTDGKKELSLRLQIKPTKGAGSGGGARETQRTECAQCLFAAYAVNVEKGKLETIPSAAQLKKASKWYKGDDKIAEILPDKLDSDWVLSCVRGANAIVKEYGTATEYYFYRGLDFDGKGTKPNTISKAYSRANKDDKKFSSEDKWNPADIWMATPEGAKIGEVLNAKEGRAFKVATWGTLNGKILDYFDNEDLIGISLKKVEQDTASFVVQNKGNKKDIASDVSWVKYDLIFESNKKKEEDRYPMDVYLYYGTGVAGRFQSRNFGGGTSASWQIERKGTSAAQGRVGGGSVERVLNNMKVQFPPKDCLHKTYDNTKIWNDCADGAGNVPAIDEIIRLAMKYKAQGIEQKTKKDDEWGDYQSKMDERSQSYRYSKLLSLYLLDTIDSQTAAVKTDIMKNLYLYASSASEESSVFRKLT
tara:strand:- start:2064 stop:3617 length:1554 start_codon:yes stop_codon:yes gene_type:complete